MSDLAVCLAGQGAACRTTQITSGWTKRHFGQAHQRAEQLRPGNLFGGVGRVLNSLLSSNATEPAQCTVGQDRSRTASWATKGTAQYTKACISGHVEHTLCARKGNELAKATQVAYVGSIDGAACGQQALALAVIAQHVAQIADTFLASCDLLDYAGTLCCTLFGAGSGVPLQPQDRCVGTQQLVVRDAALCDLILERAQRAQIIDSLLEAGLLAGQLQGRAHRAHAQPPRPGSGLDVVRAGGITHKALCGQLPVHNARHLVLHERCVLWCLVHPVGGQRPSHQGTGVALLLIQALEPAGVLDHRGRCDPGQELALDRPADQVWRSGAGRCRLGCQTGGSAAAGVE